MLCLPRVFHLSRVQIVLEECGIGNSAPLAWGTNAIPKVEFFEGISPVTVVCHAQPQIPILHTSLQCGVKPADVPKSLCAHDGSHRDSVLFEIPVSLLKSVHPNVVIVRKTDRPGINQCKLGVSL